MSALFDPRFQAVSANGVPYVGATLTFYQSGTTTPITIYSDAGATTPQTNPATADSEGKFAAIFLTTDPFKFVLKDSGGSTLATVDAIPLNAASSLDGDLTAIAALSSTGFLTRTGSNTYAQRTITAGSGISVTNGNGVSGNPTIAADLATVADVRAGTDTAKPLGVKNSMDAEASVTLTDAATIAFDMSTGINFDVTLGGNRTMGQPSNILINKQGRLRVKQDGTGSRTLSWHADYEFGSSTAPTLSTAANAEDVLYYDQLASGRTLILGPVKAVG